MSVKRANKIQKRNQKKKAQRKKQASFTIKKKTRTGRLDLDQVTPPDQVMATMLSEDVPESEWHPDDIDIIKEGLEQAKKATGERSSVKRRPNGSLTIFSDPEFEGFNEAFDPQADSDVYGNSDMIDAIRVSVLQHVKTEDRPRSMFISLSDNEVLLIKTAEYTTYSTLSKMDYISLVPEEEKASLQEFIDKNDHKKIVSYQEDDSPLMTFSYSDSEIHGGIRHSPPMLGLYASSSNDMRIAVEAVHGDNPDEFYLVEFVDEQDKNDYSAVGYEFTKSEWESFVLHHELEPVAGAAFH